MPEPIAARYEPSRAGVRVELGPSSDDLGLRHHPGVLTRPGPGGERAVPFDYFEVVGGGRRPVIVFTPILGGDGALERGIARSLAREGLHVILVQRVGKLFTPEWSDAHIEASFQEGIADRRLMIDWLERRPEVDPRRIGAFGISMGGIVTALLTPLEPRIHSAVICMAAGDIGAILRDSEEGPLVRYRERALREQGLGPEAFEARVRAAVSSDPFRLAAHVDSRSVLCFVTAYDHIVPTRQQRRLREALGNPEGIEIPSGHYGAIAFLPGMRARTLEFFRRRFRVPNDRPHAEPRSQEPWTAFSIASKSSSPPSFASSTTGSSKTP